jgi:hypothetical protein
LWNHHETPRFVWILGVVSNRRTDLVRRTRSIGHCWQIQDAVNIQMLRGIPSCHASNIHLRNDVVQTMTFFRRVVALINDLVCVVGFGNLGHRYIQSWFLVARRWRTATCRRSATVIVTQCKARVVITVSNVGVAFRVRFAGGIVGINFSLGSLFGEEIILVGLISAGLRIVGQRKEEKRT